MVKNKNLGESGLGHAALLLIVAVIATIGIVGWRVIKDTADKPTGQKVTSGKPAAEDTSSGEPNMALHNLGLASLDSVLINKQAVSEYASNGLKGFYVFGDKLPGNRLNPNFEFASLGTKTQVISAIDGVVAHINEQTESKDFEVFIQPREGSVWTVGYDHIVNLAVKKGAAIKAGDVIGKPALQNNGIPRFEIQINKDKNGQTTHYCPSALLAASVKDKLLGDLSAMQNSWEASTGLDLYNLAEQNPVGCIKKTLTPSEAEGV